MKLIEAINITKSYKGKKIISNFNLAIHKGDFIAITGESGAGKTTILNMIGLLEVPDSGDIVIDGKQQRSRKETMLIQRHKFGYLFQNYALIDNYTVADNLKIALFYQKEKDKNTRMEEALRFVNLDKDMLSKKVYELSGGEQQRVAIARLYLKESEYIFADEPTGNLDLNNRDIVFELLKKLNQSGKTVIYVTHDLELAEQTPNVIDL